MLFFQCIIEHGAWNNYGGGKKYSCVLNAGIFGDEVSLKPFPPTTSLFVGNEPMLALGR
jgi:hypothetical protein